MNSKIFDVGVPTIVPPVNKSYLQKPAVKPSCGVKKTLFKPYVLQDHQWNNPITRKTLYAGNNMTQLFDALLLFAERCVKVDGVYWMKTGIGNLWLQKGTKQDAVKDAINLWQHEVIGGCIIDKDFIDVFFDGVLKITIPGEGPDDKDKEVSYNIGSCPQFSGIITIPFGPSFVEYKNEKRLNTWINRRIDGDQSHRAKGRLLLRLIYRALCAGDELSNNITIEMDILEQQVLTDNFTNTDFRMIIHWLAGMYQRPGINILSNLWLCGLLQGIGKGTLVEIMRILLGSNMSVLLSQTEIEKGWSDHLLGKVLVEVDELDTEGKGNWDGKKWDNWIKDKTIKDEVSFTERNYGTHDVINIGNYIFTMNGETPIYLDKSDRRNYFVKTTDDAQWIRFAAELNEQIMKVDSIAMASGFGWFLERVDVDYRFINKGHNNAFKQSIQDNSMSEIEEWITFDEAVDRNVWNNSTDLFNDYVKWATKFRPGREAFTIRMFGLAMKGLSRKQQLGVQTRSNNGKSQYRLGSVVTQQTINGDAIAREIQSVLVSALSDESMGITDGLSPSMDEVLPLQVDYDNKVDEILADFSQMTSMEKMRAKLRLLESSRDHYDDIGDRD